MSLDNTSHYFRTNFPYLKETDITDFLNITTFSHLEVNSNFIQKNSLSTKAGFIIKGILRGYYLNENGAENTVFFWHENAFVLSWESAFQHKPSSLIIETLEPSELLVFDHNKLEELIQKNPLIEKAYLKITQMTLVKSLDHLQAYVSQNPQQRYLHFLKESGFLTDRIPQHYIASFLGITPVSLSRLKKRLKK